MAFFPFRRRALRSAGSILGLFALIFAATTLLTGCHTAVTNPQDPNFIVAEKGDWHVTRAELDTEVNQYLKQRGATPDQVGASKMPILQTAVLRNMVLRKVLLDRAAVVGIKQSDVDQEVNADLDKLKGVAGETEFEQQLQRTGLTVDELKKRLSERAVIQKLFQMEAYHNIEPTEQEIDDIYMKNKEAFNIPAKVRASRVLILVNDKATPEEKAAKKKAIDAARARVMHGEDFAKVAREVSEDRYSAPRGGDIGFFQRGENEPGFDDVAFNTKVNEVSPVFQTILGYQFLKVTATQPAGVVPVADARNYIASKLREQKMQEQSQAYAKKLLDDSGIVFHFTMVEPPAEEPAAGPEGAPSGAPTPGPASDQTEASNSPAATPAPDTSAATNSAPVK